MAWIKAMVLGAIVSLAASAAQAGWFGPSSYSECILDKANGALALSARRFDAERYCDERFACPSGQMRSTAGFCAVAVPSQPDPLAACVQTPGNDLFTCTSRPYPYR